MSIWEDLSRKVRRYLTQHTLWTGSPRAPPWSESTLTGTSLERLGCPGHKNTCKVKRNMNAQGSQVATALPGGPRRAGGQTLHWGSQPLDQEQLWDWGADAHCAVISPRASLSALGARSCPHTALVCSPGKSWSRVPGNE